MVVSLLGGLLQTLHTLQPEPAANDGGVARTHWEAAAHLLGGSAGLTTRACHTHCCAGHMLWLVQPPTFLEGGVLASVLDLMYMLGQVLGLSLLRRLSCCKPWSPSFSLSLFLSFPLWLVQCRPCMSGAWVEACLLASMPYILKPSL